MMRLYLIGYMGSGKSKTAEALSKIFHIPFVDTDKLVENRAGISVSEIFEKMGEERFRELEREALLATQNSESLIVATGGGTPCFFDNMKWMNENGITVFLEASPGLLFHRLAGNRSERPLLKNLSDVELMEQISGHLSIRNPFYNRAQIKISAANLNSKILAEKIRAVMK